MFKHRVLKVDPDNLAVHYGSFNYMEGGKGVLLECLSVVVGSAGLLRSLKLCRGKFGVHYIFVKHDLRLKPCSVVMIFF